MALIIIGMTIYLATKLINDANLPVVPERDEFYMYSGIHPDLYKKYLNYKNNGQYRDAFNALEDLALYADFDFRDEIYEKILKRQESLSI
jgi:hypothetical protein